jgi:spermidine/putrescine transport system substrate-binding protein
VVSNASDRTPEQGLTAGLSRRQLLKLSALGVLGATGASSLGGVARAAGTLAAADTINFINYVNWVGKDEYKNFQKSTGIHIKEIVTNTGNERITKIMADPHVADMVLLDLHSGGRLDALGKVQKLDLSKIPNYTKYVNKAFKTGLVSATSAKGIPTDYGRIGILYRSDLMTEAPTSWKDFWKLAPKYSGKVNLIVDESGVIQAALLMLGYNGNSQKQSEVHKAGDALISLKPHLLGLQAVDDGKQMVDGSAVMGLVEDFAGTSAILKNPSVALKWVDPLDGMPGYLDIWCAIKGTSKLTDVQTFMNYHLDPKVTANFINTQSIASIEPAAAKYVSAKIRANKVANPPSSVYKRTSFQSYLGLAQKYWDDEWARFHSA